MKIFLPYLAAFLVIALQGCATPKPGSPEAKALVIKEIQEQKAEAVEDTVSNMPSWCIKIPTSDLAQYSCGSGLSSNLNVARTRALLEAKRILADQFYGKISDSIKVAITSGGSEENEEILQKITTATKNIIIEAKLTGYSQKETETQAIGAKYRHYVLLEYPLGVANTAFINELKQNESIRTDAAAEKALAELEAEINKRKSNQ
jgi:hypothetical protein